MTLESLMKMISSCMQRLKEEKSTLHWIPFPIPHIRYPCQSVSDGPTPVQVKTMKTMLDAVLEDKSLFWQPRKLPHFFKTVTWTLF